MKSHSLKTSLSHRDKVNSVNKKLKYYEEHNVMYEVQLEGIFCFLL